MERRLIQNFNHVLPPRTIAFDPPTETLNPNSSHFLQRRIRFIQRGLENDIPTKQVDIIGKISWVPHSHSSESLRPIEYKRPKESTRILGAAYISYSNAMYRKECLAHPNNRLWLDETEPYDGEGVDLEKDHQVLLCHRYQFAEYLLRTVTQSIDLFVFIAHAVLDKILVHSNQFIYSDSH